MFPIRKPVATEILWNKLGSKDFRDCARIARLVKRNQIRKEVNNVVKAMIKY